MMTLSACHTMRFEVEGVQHDKIVEETNWFFVEGLFPTREIDVSEYCPAGAAAIKEQTTFLNGLIGTITLGIATPRSVWYYCLPEKSKKMSTNALQQNEVTK
jgi:Bor protein